MILFIILIVYFISAYGTYKFFQKAYSKGGRWCYMNPEIGEAISVFIPIVNQVGLVIYILEIISQVGLVMYILEIIRTNYTVNGFFRIK